MVEGKILRIANQNGQSFEEAASSGVMDSWEGFDEAAGKWLKTVIEATVHS